MRASFRVKRFGTMRRVPRKRPRDDVGKKNVGNSNSVTSDGYNVITHSQIIWGRSSFHG